MQAADAGLLLREALLIVLKLAGPVLAVALAVGLVMSLVQAVTQINEQTLAFVPKVIAIGLTLLILGSFMQTTLTDFAQVVFDRVAAAGAS
ncbi:MAG TPA: flagellar biosynthesis protein FliQ [Acetobacteraceae bacterium]|jgi:flagellar biosynthetic protein FliQ|nr:flagellar biosynthesis protein FliQ [Acetobacteraceae bacterium]